MSDQTYFLGQLLQDNSILYETIVREEDFICEFDLRVFSAIKTVIKQGDGADIATVAAFDRNIDVYHLASLTNNVMSVNWKQVERRILSQTDQTRLHGIIDIIKEEHDNDTAIQAIHRVLEKCGERSEFEITSVRDVVKESIDLIEKRFLMKGELPGIKSGITELDNLTLGFEKRKLYVIGARPSQGKTAILLNFLNNCRSKAGFISAESSKYELMTRLYAINGRIRSKRIVSGMLQEADFVKLTDVASEYSGRDVYLYDEPNMSYDTALMKAREMKHRYGIEILFVDYLQCLSGDPKLKRHEQVAEISRALKGLARRLDIPVVVSAQLRRDAEGIRPKLSDFSDSTQIERDADVAVMIYNYKKEKEPLKTYLLIEKNRDGECRDIEVIFNKENMRFENYIQ